MRAVVVCVTDGGAQAELPAPARADGSPAAEAEVDTDVLTLLLCRCRASQLLGAAVFPLVLSHVMRCARVLDVEGEARLPCVLSPVFLCAALACDGLVEAAGLAVLRSWGTASALCSVDACIAAAVCGLHAPAAGVPASPGAPPAEAEAMKQLQQQARRAMRAAGVLR